MINLIIILVVMSLALILLTIFDKVLTLATKNKKINKQISKLEDFLWS